MCKRRSRPKGPINGTNQRQDRSRGDFDGQMRFAVEAFRRIRSAVRPDCILIFARHGNGHA